MTRVTVVERQCRYDFAETVRRLDAELVARGVPVFARIDHTANAEAVGLAMPSTLVVIFGNAKAGTPLMLRAPDLALDLPLRVLIRVDTAGTVLAYHSPVALVSAHGLPADAAAALRAIVAIVDAVVA